MQPHGLPAYRGDMEAPTTLPVDPVAVIRQLDPDQIRERLAAIAEEREALLILLRATQRAKPDRKAVKA